MPHNNIVDSARTAARKAAKELEAARALDIAPAFYERLRENRGYLPSWADLSDKSRREVAQTAQHVCALEDHIAGHVYGASKNA